MVKPIDITDNNPLAVPVDAVLDKLDHGNNWVQGDWESDDGAMCLHQGIRVCEIHKGDAYLIEQVAERQGWGTTFNDEDDTTFDDVKQRLVEHREVFPHELEETFGSQWQSVVTLVRQAAALTPRQAGDLAAERIAVWCLTRDTAQHAAVNASQNTVDADGHAIGFAARNAAQDAARNASRKGASTVSATGDAAHAVAVRHLVGLYGFTQDHYTTLVAPWETVMGTDATR